MVGHLALVDAGGRATTSVIPFNDDRPTDGKIHGGVQYPPDAEIIREVC